MRRFGLLGFLAIGLLPNGGAAHPAEVDMAIDVSASVSQERWDLQRSGYAEAFRNADVIAAIRHGRHGAIAVTLIEWSSPNRQTPVLGWTVIDGEDAAQTFAAAVAEAPRVFYGSTSISGALDYAAGLLETCPHETDRKVIDVSGDGANNAGWPPDLARDRAVARGITINGLPILADEPYVDRHYREHVIGGPNAFLVIANDYASFADAILDKLVREIALVSAGNGFSPMY